MKILVIGSGFIATSIVQCLVFEGHELLVYSRTPSERVQCRQITGDIFDFEDFVKALSWNPDIIVHTAWITTPGIYRGDHSNHKYAQFTSDLAGYLVTSDVEHLIILGTCAEYGQQSGPSTAGNTKLSPISLYAEQKVAAFNAVRRSLKDSTVRLTWARIFYPYGPYQDQKRLIPHLIQALKNGETIQLTDTSSVHDWITTRDIASAISWVINHQTPVEIDVGTSLGYTNLELLTTLEETLQTSSNLPANQMHISGLNQVFVAGKNSPLFTSGWSPSDSLISGLNWMLEQ